MKEKIVKFMVLAALFLPVNISFAQSFPIKHYSDKNGLASSFVYCILQDSRGFLWFGTEHGLSQFNGSKFQNFDIEDGLINDFIKVIFEDRKGNLWLGTNKGLICKNSDGFKTYTTTDGLPHDRIHSITGDHAGNLWVGTPSGIGRFNGKNFTFYTKKDGLADDCIHDIITDKKGNLWIGTENGVSCFIKEKSRFINYTTGSGLISNDIQALMMDHKGNIWIGTKGGLNCCQIEKETGKAAFMSYSVEDGLADNYVRAIIEDRSLNIWIGTENGISFLSPSSGKFSNYYTTNGFLHDRIFTVFEDREGNIWFGTSMGVSRLQLQKLNITNFSVKDGLPNNLIWSIIEDRKGKYWIGTDKGLSQYSDGTFETYTNADGLINDSILNLLKDRSGNIWIATMAGLSVYSSKSGTFTNYTVDDGLPHEVVISLAEDRDGITWIGTAGGLCRFINGKIAPPNFDQDPLPVHAILHDRKGNLWFSDTNGLHKILNPLEKPTHFYYSDRDGLVHNKVNSLFEDSKERIWIGTKGGLSCFNNGEFINYTTADGLSDNICKFVLEDDSGNLWIGTKNGINRFDGKSFKTYTSRDGLPSNEMREGACLKDNQGNLWFGSANGLIRFNPRLERKNTVPPPVYITHINVMGKDYPISDNFRLKYDKNYLKFGFIGLCFTSPESVVYKYRLGGTDSDWFETGTREISFPSLSPGTYVFEVVAKNNDGIESLKPAKIRFRILPPFWQSWWFRMLLALLAGSMVAMIFLWHTRRIKEKMTNEARNKQLVMAQRMKLLGILAGGAVHDLKNLLGIIIGYSDIAVESANGKEDDEHNESLEVIKRTAKTAFQVVKQMLSFTRQNYDETTTSNLADLVEEILEILKISIPKNVTVVWEPPTGEVKLHINPVKFKQVVMNLCLNAVQAMQDKGELKISLFKGPMKTKQIILEISDTGPGISQEIQNKIYNPLFTTDKENGSGLGLFVVKQIVSEHRGKIRIQSKPGEGTIFRIYFPTKVNIVNF